MQAAEAAESRADAAVQKVLQQQKLQDGLSPNEESSYHAGLNLAKDIALADESRLLPRRVRSNRVKRKTIEVRQRLKTMLSKVCAESQVKKIEKSSPLSAKGHQTCAAHEEHAASIGCKGGKPR